MTSFTKVWVVVSLIRSGAACGAGPPPCSTIVTVSSPDVLRRYFGIRARSSMARGEVPHPLDGGFSTKFNPQACSADRKPDGPESLGNVDAPVEDRPNPSQGPSRGPFDGDRGVWDRSTGRPRGWVRKLLESPASHRQPDFEFPGGFRADKPRFGVVSDRFAPIC